MSLRQAPIMPANHGEMVLVNSEGYYLFGTVEQDLTISEPPKASSIRVDQLSTSTSSPGVLFGEDTPRGFTVDLNGWVGAREGDIHKSVNDVVQVLRSAPLASGVSELWVNYSGQVRVIYGRVRDVVYMYEDAGCPLADIEFKFESTTPHIFRSPVAVDVPFGISEVAGGIKEADLHEPLSTAVGHTSSSYVELNETGYVTVEIEGPIAAPQVTIGDVAFKYSGTIAQGDALIIDARPWVRQTRLRSGNFAVLDITSTKLADAKVFSGATTARLSGTDATGTSTARLAVYPIVAAY